MSQSPLTVHLFGALRVLVDGQPMARVRGRSIEWLLALLLLRHGRAVDRAWLAGTLWPESDEGQARHNLRDALTHLRKALGRAGERIQSPTRDTLTFDTDGAFVDVVQFDAALQAGAEGPMREALDLYTAPLLEGCYEAWASVERESRQQAFLSALETLADRALERGDDAGAIRLLRKAEPIDPLRDSVARRLMTALHRTGDAAAALEVYIRLRARLQTELSMAPDTATTLLFQEIRTRSRQSAADRMSPATGSLAPEPDVATASFQRPPYPLAALVGRTQEVQDVAAALLQARLVTLVGGGGVGKTCLAAEAARHCASRFAHGAAFVALASLSEPELAPAFVASALGLREDAGSKTDGLIQTLVAWLTTHEVLLILDNCEHLIEATASLAQTLLERCPNLRILATSRQRLGLMGEIAWRVPSLPVPDLEEFTDDSPRSVESALAYPAVQLFVERAAMARPGFRLAHPAETRAVAQICHRLDGIPLAIELAAARVGALPVTQIAVRLSDRFQLLTAGARTALPRHQTLEALIGWSYDLLSVTEQELLCRLSVFAGGWTLEAAERLQGDAPARFTLDTLTSLIDKSLVMVEEGEADFRYRMLETVREYSAARLRDREAESATRDGHLNYYLAWSSALVRSLTGPDPEPAVRLLEQEIDNLRVALAWAQTRDPDRYLQLAAVLWPFWEIHSHFREGRTHLRTALSLVTAPSPTRVQALLGAARLANAQFDSEEALIFGQECLEQVRREDDARGLAEVLLCLGEAHHARLANSLSVPLFEEALHFSRRSAWTPGTILATLQVGSVCMYRHQTERARESMEEALKLAESFANPRLLAIAYQQSGLFESQQGNPERAKVHLEAGLRLRRRLGDRKGTALALGCLGDVEQDRDIERAIGYWNEERTIFEALGNTAELANALNRVGNMHYRRGDYEAAARVYSDALDTCRTIQDDAFISYIRMNLGCARFHQGDIESSRRLYGDSLLNYLRIDSEEGIIWAMERFSILESHHGDIRNAIRLLGSASQMRERSGIPMPLSDRPDWEDALRAARTAVEDDSTFQRLWEAGRALTAEQALALAVPSFGNEAP